MQKKGLPLDETKKTLLTQAAVQGSFIPPNYFAMSPQAFTADERERLQQTKSYLLNHLHENIRVKQLARRSGFGEQRFHEGFRLLFLYTPGRYLHEARMQTALVLLRHTDKTIKEIAGLCGFRHYKNFLTAFKKFFGETTGEALQRT